MFDWRSPKEWWQLFRYYQAGVVNMVFAYLLFAALLALGVEVYAAQALGYVLGTLFNYFTYSRLTFSGKKANKVNYIASYVLNYLAGVALIWISLKYFPSPFISGLIATMAVSLFNYFVLKRFVFKSTERYRLD